MMSGHIGEESFVSLLFMEGEGEISGGGGTLAYQKGDSFFLSAGSGAYEINGRCQALVTTVGEN